jgi:hypothetical protein
MSKQASVEKIRAHAAGFGFELAKAQHARFDCKLHKFLRQRACGWRVACHHGEIPCLN